MKYPRKIISGGQSGADLGGLRAGKALGLETGGWMPLGCNTENGTRPSYLTTYGMTECPHPGYPARTWCNVSDSDATIVFGKLDEPGSALTVKFCNESNRHFMHVPMPDVPPALWSNLDMMERADVIRRWVRRHRIKILNVAGNRESTNPGIGKFTHDLLVRAFR